VESVAQTRTAYSPERDLVLAVLVSVLIGLLLAASPAAQDDYSLSKDKMVHSQIIARGVTDSAVVQAMKTVPRHLFVPEKYRDRAYADHPLPIEADQTISQPYIVALMTSLLQLNRGDRVLEIGTGSGYQAAVLGELVDSVFTIEIVDILARTAAHLLDSLEYTNVEVKSGDGFAGWPEKAPFAGIIVTCAAPRIPKPLIDQMAEGGRLVIPVGDRFQELLLLIKSENELDTVSVTDVRFVPMTGPGINKQEPVTDQ